MGMDNFEQGIKVDTGLIGRAAHLTVVIRIQPEVDTLKCLQESLDHGHLQGKRLLEHVRDVLQPRGFTFKDPGEATVENTEYFTFLFVSADLDQGDAEALEELMKDMAEVVDLDGLDESHPNYPEGLGPLTDDEYQLGRLYDFGERSGDIFEGYDLV